LPAVSQPSRQTQPKLTGAGVAAAVIAFDDPFEIDLAD
jgi:hypothetical protein